MDKTVQKLITHSGSFHADDIFACATLILYLEKSNKEFSAQGGPALGWEVIRTRDPEIMKAGDYVFDVGGVYDEATNRFDHHQIGGAGKGPEGIEYSSFGLVWKKFGAELCGNEKVAEIIRKKLVAPIDAHDNGMDLVENKYDISPYFVQYFFFSMVPTWREADKSTDAMFLESVEIARKVLEREMQHAGDIVTGEEAIQKIYTETKDKRILVFDQNYPSAEVLTDFPETMYVVYPRPDSTWGMKAVREDIRSFKNRKNLPAEWGGKFGEELQQLTGVSDAVFAHRALFLAVAKSKEGALKLAHMALEA